ncbi:MAG: membrane protein insertase YidC [Clostridia bacterium]|nr:membrane protein insertase YidC [Clostridia bacterium]
MDTLIYYICIPFGILMKWCWQLVGNYGLAIILFTLATKLILLPISVWIHKNSILMVKIQPQINFIKVKFYGDGDMIADEQSKLFKKEKYRPMLSLVPLLIQIILLMAVVFIIYHPLDYLFGISTDVSSALGQYLGLNLEESSFQLEVIRAIHDGRIAASTVVDGVAPETMAALCDAVNAFDMGFLGLDISVVPSVAFGGYLLVPVVAGVSAWLLCFTQNMSNVIQHEQGKLSKYGLMAVSVGISLYLGCFVPAGIALYWVASNIFAIIQMYALNAVINPKKYVDYDALEESRRALAELESLGEDNSDKQKQRENRARERKDYKKFFGIVNKHLVIYSEKSGFYKYFKDLIEALQKRSNIVIHYITNDPDDVIFEVAKSNANIKPYYVSIKKTIPLMMKLEADIVVMTTPDFDKMFIKRSVMKKDIEYIYVPHDMMSVHMGFREGALDEFDTVFCTGEHVEREVRATEKHYGLREKTLVRFGYPLADELVESAERVMLEAKASDKKEILIAPSWQEDNLLDSCIDKLIDALVCDEYHITVRPHPEYVKRYGARMKAITEKYADKVGENLTFELDFSGNKSIYSSDLLITDWSGIAPEFCFATKRPAIFINTQIKCLNPNWENIGCEPVEIALRKKLGVAMDKDELDEIGNRVAELLENSEEYKQRITDVFEAHLFNHGKAADAGAKYILSRLIEKNQKDKK